METLKKAGFTLTELLVVIAIMGMLAGILLPTVQNARERAHRAICVGNLKVIGEAFNMYNIDRGEMPPTDAVTGTNDATNIIKTVAGDIAGLGYFYDDPVAGSSTDNYIEDFSVFVCPSSDYVGDAQEVKQKWNAIPAQETVSTYIYRAESGNSPGLMLSDAKPAIVMDYNDITAPPSKYNHTGEQVNILFKNGNVKAVQNKNSAGPSKDAQLTLGGIGISGGIVNIDTLFHDVCGMSLCGGADYYQ